MQIKRLFSKEIGHKSVPVGLMAEKKRHVQVTGDRKQVLTC